MNDETPNLFETVGDEPLEARIVAWVVGEASSFEVAELERLCAERPELLIFRRRMLALQGLLRQAEAVEPDRSWKLPASKRRMLDEILGEENGRRFAAPQVVPRRHYAGRAWFAIAACLVLTVVVRELMSAKSLVPKVAVSSPVQATGVPTLGPGLTAKSSTGAQPNGQQWVLYNGHLLYAYSGDQKVGDVTGNGIGSIWYAVTAAGERVPA